MAEEAKPSAPVPPADPKPETPPKPPADPKPTDDDAIEAKVQERLKAERAKDEQKALKDKAKAEEEEARKRGEFEKLHGAEKAAREAAEKALATERLSKRVVRAIVAETAKHVGYDAGKLESYLHDRIVSGLDAEATDAAVAKATGEAVAAFVKDFPIAVKGTGAPAGSPGHLRQPVPDKPAEPAAGGNGRRNLSPITRGF